jgi:hypothetical protein
LDSNLGLQQNQTKSKAFESRIYTGGYTDAFNNKIPLKVIDRKVYLQQAVFNGVYYISLYDDEDKLPRGIAFVPCVKNSRGGGQKKKSSSKKRSSYSKTQRRHTGKDDTGV